MKMADSLIATKAIEVLKGGPGSGSWESPGNPRFAHRGKPEGEDNSSGSDSTNFGGKSKKVKDIVSEYGRKNKDPKWQEALKEADSRVVSSFMKSVPDIEVHAIESQYVHEPRVRATTKESISSLSKKLKESGWEAPKKWDKQDSKTWKKGEDQITASKSVNTGGSRSGLREIAYFAKYKLEDFNL
jgi:hypothetical protein